MYLGGNDLSLNILAHWTGVEILAFSYSPIISSIYSKLRTGRDLYDLLTKKIPRSRDSYRGKS